MGRQELYIESGSKKTDASLHDAILNNPKADKALAFERAARLSIRGWTAREIAELYG